MTAPVRKAAVGVGGKADDPYRVPAVVAAATVLEVLAGVDGDGLTHAEIVREAEISKSTAHNLLVTLESLGWVRRTSGRGYRLGGELVRLGALAAGGADALALAIESLDDLVAAHGLTFAVARVTAPDVAEIVAAVFPEDIHVGISRGTSYGPFDGAIGKVLLVSHTPEDARRAIKGGRLLAHTDQTLTDADALLEQLDLVRHDGYATSIREYRQNNAVAVGVYGREALEAVLLTIGFPDQLTEEAIPSIGHVLRDVADAITAQCGGRGPAARRADPMHDAGERPAR